MGDDGQIKPLTVIAGAAAFLISALVTLVGWFAVHTITAMSTSITTLGDKYEKTGEVISSLRQQVVLLQYSFDAHSKVCNASKQTDSGSH